MTNIYLDIETIPGQQSWLADEIRASLSAPSNYKDPDKIQAYIDEAFEAALDKTVFDGAYAHIVCISVAIDDAEPISFYSETPQTEKEMLAEFMSFINQPMHKSGFTDNKRIIGHNVQGFDIPMLRKRCTILGVPVSSFIPLESKPWDGNPYDTMMKWDSRNFCSLDKLLKAFGLGEKGDTNGSMVYQMWKNGKHEEIKKYCEEDVIKVRKLYKKMTFEDLENYTASAVSSVGAADQPQKAKRLNLN